MAESEPNHARKLIYLLRMELDPICFLQEALYWVAFGRLPIEHLNRLVLIEGYKTNVPRDNGELSEEECERAGLPRDPRLNYDWADNVMLSDQIEEIAASRELVEAEPGQDEGVRKEQARREAEKLLDEMTEWKPKFERAIELAATEVYAVFRKGRLASRGVRLPNPNVAASLKLLAEQNKQLGELEIVAIPKDFWSLPNIYWEISAARNETEHYCHIHCPTNELMALFPIDAVTVGESVDGVMRHGSFYVLSADSGAAAVAPARRGQVRGRVAGRPPLYRWDYLHVEMAGLVRKGLPAKREAAAADLRDIYRRKFGDPVPAVRTLLEWLEPYYEQYFGN
jgi:hypothetical protein